MTVAVWSVGGREYDWIGKRHKNSPNFLRKSERMINSDTRDTGRATDGGQLCGELNWKNQTICTGYNLYMMRRCDLSIEERSCGDFVE